MTTLITATNEAAVNVLNTVGTLANSATKAVTTVASTIDMLDLFVGTQLTKQRMRTKVDMHTFLDELIEETSMENSERQLKITDKLTNNVNLAKLYAENETKLRTLLTTP